MSVSCTFQAGAALGGVHASVVGRQDWSTGDDMINCPMTPADRRAFSGRATTTPRLLLLMLLHR